MPNHQSQGTRCAVVTLAPLLLVSGLATSAASAQTWQQKSRILEAQQTFGLDGRTPNGNGVLLGQIELGIASPTHNAFSLPNPKFRFTYDPGSNIMVRPHATRVASIMAGNDPGNYIGTAPAARMAVTDWKDPDGAGALTISDDFLDKMKNFFLQNPISPIVNMSAGLTVAGTATFGAEHIRIADWAGSNGLLFVVAAGNDGNAANTIKSPNAAYNGLTVGATGDTNGAGAQTTTWDQIGAFSSRGPVNTAAWAGDVPRNKPDLVAPGGFIRSAQSAVADNSYGTMDPGAPEAATGTSFAAPQVSGTAALLHDFSYRHGNLDRDSRVMRAVLMNSTNKTVKDDAGTRWDEVAPALGRGTSPLSNDTGTGRLDAVQAVRQYAGGKVAPTLGNGGTLADVPNTAWDKGVVVGAGEVNSNDYLIDKKVRKGSYITSTLSWNRGVVVGGAGNSPANYLYDNLNDLDLGVAKLGAINTILQKSNSLNNTNEHLVYKVPDRDQYYVRAWMTTNASVMGNTETYGLAWHSFTAPTATRDFNGGFSPNMGAPVDNGWYRTAGVARVGEAPWAPDNDNKYAMQITTADSMAQECVTPIGSFRLSFSFGFALPIVGESFQVLLGGINLLQHDNVAGNDIVPTILGTNGYDFYDGTVDFSTAPGVWAALAAGFTELSFVSAGGTAYVDDVYYIPAPGALAFAATGALVFARRRRSRG